MPGGDLFGQRLRELREGAGLSREQLAERARVSVRGLEKWEQGIREPLWSNIQSLAEALGVDCTAFTVAPAATVRPGPGRPSKARPEATEPKRPRGRPRKEK